MTNDRVIINVFGIFDTDYRALWTRSVDEDMWPAIIKRWANELKIFDEDVVLIAAKNTFKYHPVSPPTLGQFFSLCRLYKKENDQIKTKKIEYHDIREHVDPITESVAVDSLAKMREAFLNVKKLPLDN